MRRAGWKAALFIGAAAVGWAALPTEHDLRAAYIFNILRFSEQHTIAYPNPVLTLAIYAAGPVEPSLMGLEGNAIRGRKLHIRIVQQESELQGCDALYMGRTQGRAAKFLAAATVLGLLTIGVESDFIPAGGMIALLVESRRIVVEVNPVAIAAGGWTVSSHLLEIARMARRSDP